MSEDSHETLKEKIIGCLEEVEYSELITVQKGVPHTRPMVYANDCLTIYMVTKNNANKVLHIQENQNVSVLVLKSFQKPENVKEIIIEGVGEIVGEDEERNKAFNLFDKKPKAYQIWAGKSDLNEYTVIRITPNLIKYFDYSKKEGMPLMLKV